MGYHGFLPGSQLESDEEERRTHKHLRQISPEDTGDVMCGICFLLPVERLAVLRKESAEAVESREQPHPRRGFKGGLKVAHAFIRPIDPKRARNFGGCKPNERKK